MSKLNTFCYIRYTYKPTEKEILNDIKNEEYYQYETKGSCSSFVAQEIFDKLYPNGVWDMIDDEDEAVYIILFEENKPKDFEVVRCYLEYNPAILFEDIILD
ncbi:hypothetical protein ACFFHK_02625 [Gallibacterium trehalosifermentans]|uniref:Uncharacterized protein n=1 Tax=Gallibacterium trehalosifermentans TaxID=516935 RepID=A0ABV6GZ09_9PAST